MTQTTEYHQAQLAERDERILELEAEVQSLEEQLGEAREQLEAVMKEPHEH